MVENPVDEDQSREAALASTPLFQPNFKSSKVTQAQLDKFKELHNRRLQIKETSKDRERVKGSARRGSRVGKEDIVTKDTKGVRVLDSEENSKFDAAEAKPNSNHLDEATPTFSPKKRQKLHWGLDAKERWERKANM